MSKKVTNVINNDHYKSIINIIYQDVAKRKEAYINSIFNGTNDEVMRPKFIGQAADCRWSFLFLDSVLKWAESNEGNLSMALPSTFLPEFNESIRNIMFPVEQQQKIENVYSENPENDNI